MMTKDALLVLQNEPNASDAELTSSWNIMLIDDDMDVHTSTKLALNNVRIHDRPLNLIHAFSGIDGIAYLKDMTRVDLILLDMIMETRDAGLKVTRWLRESEERTVKPKVILRTGHPGLVITDEILMAENFDGMIEKSRVTYHNLVKLLSEMLADKI